MERNAGRQPNEPLTDEADSAAAVIETLPDREARSPFLRHFLHLGLPISLSLLLHVVVLALLALKTFQVLSESPAAGGEYRATLTPRDVDPPEAQLDWSAIEPIDQPRGVAGGTTDGDPTGLDIPTPDVLTDGAFGGIGIADEGLGVGTGALSILGSGGGAGGAGTGGLGSGFGTGGSVGRAGIWDLRVHATRVAYVIDFSGSIIVAVDDLKHELKRSIGRLAAPQEFNVIVFYSQTSGAAERVLTESFQPQLVPATDTYRRGFFDWIDRRAPEGTTEPLPALKRALALQPDAVFFFSDGYFDDDVVTEVTRINAGQSRIYCLVFDELLLQDASDLPRDTEGSRRLRRIAEANDGRTKIVTARDLVR